MKEIKLFLLVSMRRCLLQIRYRKSISTPLRTRPAQARGHAAHGRTSDKITQVLSHTRTHTHHTHDSPP